MTIQQRNLNRLDNAGKAAIPSQGERFMGDAFMIGKQARSNPRLLYGFALVGWILLSLLAGVIGSQFSPGEWYAGLDKPSWNPPAWIFAPVWTALYCMMGIAAWLVWRRGGWTVNRVALSLFLCQLVLNALWSWIFFGLHQMQLALIEIVLLWTVVLATMLTMWKTSKASGLLLLPYLGWLSFATLLNFTLWKLNT
jgi:tryptophan-rich sensory protein